jgi:hypothetical protein
MVVDLHEDCGGAIVRRPYAHERDELRERPAVKTFLDAYHLDQFEARVSVAADKPKIKDAMGGTMRLRSGETIRFTGKGPDAR